MTSIHRPPLQALTLNLPASPPPQTPPLFPGPHNLPIVTAHPRQQQLHLQLSNPAAQASPDPVAKWHRAKWVLVPGKGRVPLPQPAVRLEALRLREGAGVPGHHIVAEHKLGLQGRDGQCEFISKGLWALLGTPTL